MSITLSYWVYILKTFIGITIAFSAVEFTTPNEIDTFRDVCAIITDGEIDRDVEFSITSIPGGTATSKSSKKVHAA